MQRFNILGIALAGFTLALCAPAPLPQNLPPQTAPQYFLRVYSPEQPWHNRHLVQLQTSKLLGLENFTIHPTTPPVFLTPIKVPKQETYALKLPYGGDDLSSTPYIAALQTPSSDPAPLGPIYVPDPTRRTIEANPQACPRGRKCVADAFSMYQGDSGSERLSYEGFPGSWVAEKDAPNSEGWHVYWRPKASVGEQEHLDGSALEIEVVPKANLDV